MSCWDKGGATDEANEEKYGSNTDDGIKDAIIGNGDYADNISDKVDNSGGKR